MKAKIIKKILCNKWAFYNGSCYFLFLVVQFQEIHLLQWTLFFRHIILTVTENQKQNHIFFWLTLVSKKKTLSLFLNFREIHNDMQKIYFPVTN